jgi:predicted RNA-binding protein YlxR (DUF448 family)
MRMCCVCRVRKEKHELIKITKTKDRVFDINGNVGRGAYICNNRTCIELAIKKKSLNRSFKCEVDSEVYKSLQSKLIIINDSSTPF